MTEKLAALDIAVFKLINGLHHPVLDTLMYYITGNLIWIPLYALIVYRLWLVYKVKIWFPLLAVALAITAADRFTSGYMKPAFERLRPCHNPELQPTVHIVEGHCGGAYGFASSHAANTFAVAVLLAGLFSMEPTRKWKTARWLIVWAAVVSYSRIYLGVHYPGDVIVGALVGYTVAQLLLYACSILRHKIM